MAATQIQAAYRAHRALAQVHQQHADVWDRAAWPCSSYEEWHERTRLLLFATTASRWDPAHGLRVSTWTEHLFQGAWVYTEGWYRLVGLMARQMVCALKAHAEQMGVTASTYVATLAALVPEQAPTEAQQRLMHDMVRWHMHAALHAYLHTLSVEPTKEATVAAALALRPFVYFANVDDTTRAVRTVALDSFVHAFCTTPRLLARIQREDVASFEFAFPLDEVLAHVQHAGSARRADDSLHLLANVVRVAASQIAHMTAATLQAYLAALAFLEDALPRAVFSAEPVEKMTSSDPIVDDATAQDLAVVVSDEHVLALLSQSTRFAAQTRRALCVFLVATLHAWPVDTGDHLLTTLLYGYHPTARAAQPTTGALVRELWRGYVRGSRLARQLSPSNASARVFETRRALTDAAFADEWPVLTAICQLYGRCLMTLGDDEFFPANSPDGSSPSRNPLSLDELVSLSGLLRNIAFTLYWQDDLAHGAVVPGTQLPLAALRDAATRLLQQLHTRDARHAFTPASHWHMLSDNDLGSFIQAVVVEERERSTSSDMDVDEPPHTSRAAMRSTRAAAMVGPRLGVLNHLPFVIPFDVRVEIFRQFVRSDAERLHISRDFFSRTQRHRATVRRASIAEDGIAQLNSLGPHLKEPVEIVFIDQFGQPEAGIDGGGVFKEFLTTLMRQVFDTDRGLWRANELHELYPNPHSYARAPEQLSWYTFLGRILGKALYEDILVDVHFASFFLGKWLGHQGYLDDLASLQSLDAALYRGLIALKNYTGDVENDFALNFTVSDEEFGTTHTTELVPGGAELPVTKDNRLAYIYHVARYRLSKQIEPQCHAFIQGLTEMIEPRWLRLFSRDELGVLVCGVDAPVDLADLRANTVYGGYHEKDLSVTYFWEAVESLSQDAQKALLRFVTSSPNPPLLGFGELNPKFAIRHAGDDVTRLPTASTCVNLLKLPAYTSRAQALEKIQYAIHSQAGFDLS